MSDKNYHIDGQPVDFTEIIKKAKEYGYNDDILQSSVAAKILREHGHKVGNIWELKEATNG